MSENTIDFNNATYNAFCCCSKIRKIFTTFKIGYRLDILGYILEIIKYVVTWKVLFDEYSQRVIWVLVPFLFIIITTNFYCKMKSFENCGTKQEGTLTDKQK